MAILFLSLQPVNQLIILHVQIQTFFLKCIFNVCSEKALALSGARPGNMIQ